MAEAAAAARSRSESKKLGKSDRATICAACSKHISHGKAIPCKVCTAVVFCSAACVAQPGSHECDAASAQGQSARDAENIVAGIPRGRSESIAEELKREVHSKLPRECQPTVRNPRGKLKFYDLLPHADQGHAAAAYMVGVMLSQRAQSVPGDKWLTQDAAGKPDKKSVLQTNFLAVKYFRVAAEGGVHQAMLSLADKLKEGKGEPRNRRESVCWAWKALVEGCSDQTNARGVVEEQGIVKAEIKASLDSLFRTPALKQEMDQGRTVKMGGPNLGTLLFARRLHNGLVASNFKLPSLGGPGAGWLDIVGADAMKVLNKFISKWPQGRVELTYGRSGSAPSATAMSMQGCKGRSVDNTRLVLGAAPKTLDCEDVEAACDGWAEAARAVAWSGDDISALCVHRLGSGGSETEEGAGGPSAVCAQCVAAAKERLSAAATGSYAFSEAGNDTQSLVVYRCRADSPLRSEEYKEYSRAEVVCVLTCLAADAQRELLAHPCFLAQDPSLFWPTLCFFGSVRAALKYCAPHVKWTKLWGRALAPPPPAPLLEQTGTSAKNVVVKCGSPACCRLFWEKPPQRCSICNRRGYCDRACFKADWRQHKLECVKEAAPVDEEQQRGAAATNSGAAPSAAASAKPPKPGAVDVVVRSKKSSLLECIHGNECCAACSLDFRAANQLWHLWQHREDGATALPAGAVQQTIRLFLQSLREEADESDGEVFQTVDSTLERAVPNAKRRAWLLKNLESAVTRQSRDDEDGEGSKLALLLRVSSAAAFACFTARRAAFYLPKATTALQAWLAIAIAWDGAAGD